MLWKPPSTAMWHNSAENVFFIAYLAVKYCRCFQPQKALKIVLLYSSCYTARFTSTPLVFRTKPHDISEATEISDTQSPSGWFCLFDRLKGRLKNNLQNPEISQMTISLSSSSASRAKTNLNFNGQKLPRILMIHLIWAASFFLFYALRNGKLI